MWRKEERREEWCNGEEVEGMKGKREKKGSFRKQEEREGERRWKE